MKNTYKVTGYIETYCPYCGSDNTHMVYGTNEYEYRRCYNCGGDYEVEFEYVAVCVTNKHNVPVWTSKIEED